MLSNDLHFVRELNEKVTTYCRYVTNAKQYDVIALQRVLDEIQQNKQKIEQNHDRYEHAQYEFRPHVPFQSLVDELTFCEAGLTGIIAELNQYTPKYR